MILGVISPWKSSRTSSLIDDVWLRSWGFVVPLSVRDSYQQISGDLRLWKEHLATGYHHFYWGRGWKEFFRCRAAKASMVGRKWGAAQNPSPAVLVETEFFGIPYSGGIFIYTNRSSFLAHSIPTFNTTATLPVKHAGCLLHVGRGRRTQTWGASTPQQKYRTFQ